LYDEGEEEEEEEENEEDEEENEEEEDADEWGNKFKYPPYAGLVGDVNPAKIFPVASATIFSSRCTSTSATGVLTKQFIIYLPLWLFVCLNAGVYGRIYRMICSRMG
jgi:hypothetical protein